MSVLFIVGCCITYFIIGTLTAGFFSELKNDNNIACGVFWPITLSCLIMSSLFSKVSDLVKLKPFVLLTKAILWVYKIPTKIKNRKTKEKSKVVLKTKEKSKVVLKTKETLICDVCKADMSDGFYR